MSGVPFTLSSNVISTSYGRVHSEIWNCIASSSNLDSRERGSFTYLKRRTTPYEVEEAVVRWPEIVFPAVTQKYLILERMLAATARGGHVDLHSARLDFGQQLGVAAPYMITRNVVKTALHQVIDAFDLLLVLRRLQSEVFLTRMPMGHHILDTVCYGSKRDARYACWEMVECLLQHGAIVAKSKAQRAAAWSGRVDVLKALLRYGADLNECFDKKDLDGPPGAALHVAAVLSHVEAVRRLVENGADPKLENCNGSTPGDLLSGDTEIALLLGITT
ncbi:hypothetical protein BU16DRAFT_593714 [Lophium mytilinum]|uniref:Uncharacterized protein n=1 Tax=Lophium mytilinum TaxID=390894 RepID=A0A6A6QJP0_9PEZI|nr:hypothetical protein BU16DRAFT_593714 [Lophium mytilinum]